MGRSPLILAALAKDAVPALDFDQVVPLDSESRGHFDSVILTSSDGEHYVMKMPNGQAAGLALDTELQAIRALRSNLRLQLPFNVTNLVGETRDQKGTRALLFSYVYGDPIDISRIPATSPLLSSIGEATAAIHNLPLATVEDSGLPVFTPAQTVQRNLAMLDRAGQSGQIPASLRHRWEQALEDINLFRYQPTVVHGTLYGQTMLSLDSAVSGVLEWGTLQIGDPAADLTWILGGGSDDVGYTTLLAYQAARPSVDENLRQRVQLYSELEYARALLEYQLHSDAEGVASMISLLQDLATNLDAGVLPELKPTPIGGGFSASLSTPAAAQEPIFANDGFSFANLGGSMAEVSDDTKPLPIISEPVFAESSSLEEEALFLKADLRPADLANTGEVPNFLSDETVPIEVIESDASSKKSDGELF